MGYRIQVATTLVRDAIIADEADPTTDADGYIVGKVGGDNEVVTWYVAASAQTDTATGTFWFMDSSNSDHWHRGSSFAITGSVIVDQEMKGDRVDLRLTTVAGSFDLRAKGSTRN